MGKRVWEDKVLEKFFEEYQEAEAFMEKKKKYMRRLMWFGLGIHIIWYLGMLLFYELDVLGTGLCLLSVFCVLFMLYGYSLKRAAYPKLLLWENILMVFVQIFCGLIGGISSSPLAFLSGTVLYIIVNTAGTSASLGGVAAGVLSGNGNIAVFLIMFCTLILCLLSLLFYILVFAASIKMCRPHNREMMEELRLRRVKAEQENKQRENKRIQEICQSYPDISGYIEKRKNWINRLQFITMILLCAAMFFGMTGNTGSGQKVYSLILLIPIIFVQVSLVIHREEQRKPFVGLFCLIIFIIGVDVFSFAYLEAGISFLGGCFAAVGLAILKAGVLIPEIWEEYVYYVYLEWGVEFMVQGVMLTIYYMLNFCFALWMLLPENRKAYRKLNELYEGWEDIQKTERPDKLAEELNFRKETVGEKRPWAKKWREQKLQRQKYNELLGRKYAEIYKVHPDMGTYMKKRVNSIWSITCLGFLGHIFWVICALGSLPVHTMLFSLVSYIAVAAALYRCMSDKAERSYILLLVVSLVIIVNLLPSVHRLVGNTLIFFIFTFIYYLLKTVFGLETGLPGSYTYLLLDAFNQYADRTMAVYGIWVGIYYFIVLKLAIQMSLPKNIKTVKSLKELSEKYDKEKKKIQLTADSEAGEPASQEGGNSEV